MSTLPIGGRAIGANRPWYHPTSPEQERGFYASIRLENGTYKTTAEHRLDDINIVLSDLWKAESYSPKSVLDIGVSSGVSTVEWLDHLRACGYQASMTGTDLCLSANLISLGAYEFLATNTHVLGHALFGHAFRSYVRRRDYITGRVILTKAANALAELILRTKPDPAAVVILLSEEARSSHIQWIEEDIFKPSAGTFDVIRAANVLNLAYFSREQITAALGNIRERLCPGAWLVVCRTHPDGSNHGTVYRAFGDGRLKNVHTIGDGSEIDRLVLT